MGIRRCTRRTPSQAIPITGHPSRPLAGNAAEVPKWNSSPMTLPRHAEDIAVPLGTARRFQARGTDCTISIAALEAGHAEIFVAERAATMPSAGILLAIRRRSFARAASIYISQVRAAPAAYSCSAERFGESNVGSQMSWSYIRRWKFTDSCGRPRSVQSDCTRI